MGLYGHCELLVQVGSVVLQVPGKTRHGAPCCCEAQSTVAQEEKAPQYTHKMSHMVVMVFIEVE